MFYQKDTPKLHLFLEGGWHYNDAHSLDEYDKNISETFRNRWDEIPNSSLKFSSTSVIVKSE